MAHPRLRMLLLEDRLTPGAGDLDPTFGTGGIVNLPAGLQVDQIDAQTDGRLVVLGRNQSDRVIFRLLHDGSFDPSYGTDGFSVKLPGSLESLAVMPDGRILLTGFTSAYSTSSDFIVVR